MIRFYPYLEVKPEPVKPPRNPATLADFISEVRRQRVEAVSANTIVHQGESMSLAHTIGLAYNNHYKLTLAPDHIWLTILHGFSQFMARNAETVRKEFVSHEGQTEIMLQATDFRLGGDNDWPRLFGEFNGAIRSYLVPDKADLFSKSFSTSTTVDTAAGNILVMSAMQKYFTYGFRTCCGFPEIVLEGEYADWVDIKYRVLELAKLPGIQWWTDHLIPVCDQLVRTAEGNVYPAFWRDMYQEGGGSGGPFITGWINALYPYMATGKNTYMGASKGFGSGNTPDSFPTTLGAAPVTWDYYGTKYPLDFVAGVCGYEVVDGGIRPTTAWAVTHRDTK